MPCSGASFIAQSVNNLPAMQGTWVWSMVWEHTLEEGMATHSSILACRIPWTEEPGRLQSMGILHARILEWVALPSSRGISQPRDRTQVFHIVGGFFTIWATREAQNTGMGSLSLLQRNFPTQKSNQGLLHCRQILYQQSYQGIPLKWYWSHIQGLQSTSDTK